MTERVNDRRIGVRVRLEPKLYDRLAMLAKAHALSTTQMIVYLLSRLIDKNDAQLTALERVLSELDIS
jgi:hypothetical protein